MLAEWAVSLRHVAGYAGEAMVLSYGLPGPMRAALAKWGVRTVDCLDRGCIVCSRYLDAIPLLAREYQAHLAAHFDADVWFQAPIDGLFGLAAERPPGGCVFAPDVGWFTQPPHGGTAYAAAYERKVRAIRALFGGTIQGGMSCGTGRALSDRYGQFRAMLESGSLETEYGADQFSFNWLFDPEADSAAAHLWNCIGADAVLEDGVWFSKRNGGRTRAIGVHVVGMCRNEPERLFRNLHEELLARELGAVGLSGGNAVVMPSWGPSSNGDAWAAIASVIVACRRHPGSPVAVGIPAPRAAFSDVGCTAAVPLSHGHDHYWDRLGLPRRPHIAHPHKLYLSARAVEVLSRTPLDAAWELCERFERSWFDFMLTMLCASRGLSWGPIWPGAPLPRA